MPTIDVAEIYTDPWTETDYEGMAVIVEEDLHSVETTLLGITCRLYWVRFFYTEINLSRWVEVSSILVWEDFQRRSIPCSWVTDHALMDGYGSQIRRSISSSAGATWTYYLGVPPLSVDDTILRFGCQFSIPTQADATTFVALTLFSHDSSDPNAAANNLADYHLHTQSATYIPFLYTFPTPVIVANHPSLSLRLRIYEKVTDTFTYYIYLKDPFIDIVRLV